MMGSVFTDTNNEGRRGYVGQTVEISAGTSGFYYDTQFQYGVGMRVFMSLDNTVLHTVRSLRQSPMTALSNIGAIFSYVNYFGLVLIAFEVLAKLNWRCCNGAKKFLMKGFEVGEKRDESQSTEML
jgi:hypothetical protein